MLLSLSIKLDRAEGVSAEGLAWAGIEAAVVAGLAWAEAGTGGGAGGIAVFPTGADFLAEFDSGEVPLTTLAAENVGTGWLSFLIRIEILRLEGS
jgi:hypothetical protein